MERAMTPLPLIDRTPIKDALEPVDRVAVEMEGKWAAVVIRGWHALDKAATEAGHKTYPQGVWSAKHRGTTYTVVLDRADVNKVAHDSKDAGHVVTLAELLLVWDEFQGNRVISQTKSLFPGATVEKVGGIAELDDDIPWN
jgi:hypothetical protein